MKVEVTFKEKDRFTKMGWYYVHVYDDDGNLKHNDSSTYTNKRESLKALRKYFWGGGIVKEKK